MTFQDPNKWIELTQTNFCFAIIISPINKVKMWTKLQRPRCFDRRETTQLDLFEKKKNQIQFVQ